MAGYSNSEIEAAVAKYVQSVLKIDRSPLGPVDADSKFNEVTGLIASTLIYDPNAIFYVLFLASNRLNVDVLTLIGYLDDLLDAIDEMSKRTTEVTKTSLLGDAAASLLMVDQVISDKNALSGQAYIRYQTAVDRFIETSLKNNIKTGSEIVRPPQLARAAAKSDLERISTAYETLLENVTQLMGALGEFDALNLPLMTILDSVRKVRMDLRDLQTYFESSSYSKDAKIAACREAYLRLTSGRAVLDNYTTVEDPKEARIESSSTLAGVVALPYETGEVSPATVVGTKSGPWPIVGTMTLSVAADGSPPTVYNLVASPLASIRSYAPAPYDIVSGVNDLLEIDGLPFPVNLTHGVGRTAAQIVTDVVIWMLSHYPGQYSASVLSEGGKDYVKITKSATGQSSISMTADSAPNRDIILATYGLMGFYEGQRDDLMGMSADELVAVFDAVGEVTATVDRTLFEEGTTGSIVDAVTIDMPLNTFNSLSHGEDKLLIRKGVNSGYRRITSITRPGIPSVDRVTIDALTPLVVTPDDQDWLVIRERIRLTSKSTGLGTSLVIGSGTANTVIGLTTGTTVGSTTGIRATESGVEIDFSRYDVVIGDVVYLTDDTPTQTQHTIVDISPDNKQVEISPEIPSNYVLEAFKIYSSASVAYELFAGAMVDWVSRKDVSHYREGTLELDRLVNPLLVNRQPSLAQLSDARAAATELRDLLTKISPAGLTEILVSFVVSPVSRIDAALKMLKERGLDRAFDLLMRAQISSFFNMGKDDAGSSAFMLKSMRSVVQLDLQVSKSDDDVDDTFFTSSSTDTDADFDFSDQDRDENVRILGEVPDYTSDSDESVMKRLRY